MNVADWWKAAIQTNSRATMSASRSLIRNWLITALVSSIAVGAVAQRPREVQSQLPWYEAMRLQLSLAPLSRLSDGIRFYKSDRRGAVIIIQMVVLPDNLTARLTVINGVSHGDRIRQTSHISSVLARADFERLKSTLLDTLLPRSEIVAPSTVKGNEIWVCADGPLVTMEVALGQPTPLYLRREASCATPDPALAAAKVLEAFASSSIHK